MRKEEYSSCSGPSYTDLLPQASVDEQEMGSVRAKAQVGNLDMTIGHVKQKTAPVSGHGA